VSETEEKGKTLVIEKYDYGIRVFIDDPDINDSFFIKDNENNPGWCVIAIEKDFEAVDFVDNEYSNFGVNNLSELISLFQENPSLGWEMLTGDKIKIDHVKVIEEKSPFNS
jgi:hypothetical protein